MSFAGDGPIQTLISGLNAQGFEVYVWSYPGEGSNQDDYLIAKFDADSTGASARNEWLTAMTTYKTLFTQDKPTYLMGFSWGGLMAQHILQANSEFDGIFVHLAADDPNFLTEFTAYSLSTLATIPTAVASTKVVYTSWALDDTRVGFLEAKNWNTAVGGTGKEYVVLGHNTTAGVIADLLVRTALLPA